jgi:hypothetical protein
MFAVTAILACVLLAMLLAPDTQMGRMRHGELAERPVKWLAQLTRQKLIYLGVITALVLGGWEIALMIGPELLAVYGVDLAIYIDVVVVGYALAKVREARAGLQHLRLRLSQLRPGRRKAPRSQRTRRRTRAPANDDGTGPARLAA